MIPVIKHRVNGYRRVVEKRDVDPGPSMHSLAPLKPQPSKSEDESVCKRKCAPTSSVRRDQGKRKFDSNPVNADRQVSVASNKMSLRIPEELE